MQSINWTTIGVLAGTVVPLLGIPLALVSQYIKGIHEIQVKRTEDLIDRINYLGEQIQLLSKVVHEFERHYTTKEEWLREMNQTRSHMEKVTEMVTQLQMENRRP